MVFGDDNTDEYVGNEQYVSSYLRVVLEGTADGAIVDMDDDSWRELAGSLELFLPIVLSEIHSEWKYESLDGIYPAEVHKTGKRSLEFWGMCILISDQSLTLLHVELQIAPDRDQVIWCDLRLGERGRWGIERIAYSSSKWQKGGFLLGERLGSVDWVYHICFGERQPE
jgi:hypothetical protein